MAGILVVLLGLAVCIGSLGDGGQPRLGRASHVPRGDALEAARLESATVPGEVRAPLRSGETDGYASRTADARLVPSVAFFPNPVRDVVTFVARDVCWCSVRGLRVVLYDEAGWRVLEEVTDMAILETDTISTLPNGLYLASFEISIGGTWTHAGRGLLGVLH